MILSLKMTDSTDRDLRTIVIDTVEGPFFIRTESRETDTFSIPWAISGWYFSRQGKVTELPYDYIERLNRGILDMFQKV